MKIIKLGRGGVLGQGKGSGSWVKKRLMGMLVVNGNTRPWVDKVKPKVWFKYSL